MVLASGGGSWGSGGKSSGGGGGGKSSGGSAFGGGGKSGGGGGGGGGGASSGISIQDILKNVIGTTRTLGTVLKSSAQAKQDNLLNQAANSGSGSGSGSGYGVDHFFDVNPLNQAMFDQDVNQTKWQNDFDTTQFNWKKANDDRDYALAVGDLDLARQKQKDANYWQGKSYELEQSRMALDERMNSANNATRTNIAQMEAASRAETARIAAQADRYAADLRLQEGLANATNDQERNRVLLAHEQEIASIAKMEDQTKRMIASGDQKIGGFNAETARMAQMGDVALKNNQFLLDASSTPRDLFGLYFMQRGITPDWNSLAAGNPTQGEGLKVYDPMKAYDPNITMPQDFNMADGSAFGDVGNASNISLNANPFIQMGMQQTQQQQSQPAIPGYARGTDRFQRLVTNAVHNTAPSNTNAAPKGMLSNTNVLDFGQAPGAFNQASIGAKRRADNNYWQGFNSAPSYSPPRTQQQPAFVPPMQQQPANRGYTTEPKFMTGDAGGRNPWMNGAKPEIIENPTQAPIRVKNTMQTAADFGIPQIDTQPINRPVFGQVQRPIQQPAFTPPRGYGQVYPPTMRGSLRGQGFNIQDYIRQFIEAQQNRQGLRRVMPRYPIGTDLSQQYANMGMSQLWQNSSNNDHLQGVENIPTWLQTLADYGTPIAPSLANSVTGRTSPTLNIASAFNQRGGGILPSLQTLNRQSAGENQLFEGYLNGPVGMPTQDTLDFIGRPTQNLRTAQRSSAIMN